MTTSAVRRTLILVTCGATALLAQTDGLFTRNAGIPTYGVVGLASEQDEPSLAHGRDERIGADAFHRAVASWGRLVQQLAGPTAVVP